MSSDLGQEIISYLESLHTTADGQRRINICGLMPSARAFVLAKMIASKTRRIAVICSNSNEAAQLHQDLKTFLLLLGKSEEAQSIEYFSGWEQSPYQGFNPSLKNRIRRQKVLHRILKGECTALICGVEAFAQRFPSRTFLETRGFKLERGSVISRDELIRKLELAGYTRNDPVEDVGSYTFRGSIVDVYSPSARKPFRLDFFDDELESIKAFDPASQRSEKNSLTEAEIFTVSDWPFNQDTVAVAKSGIKVFCDSYGIPKQSRDPFFEMLDTGVRDLSLEYLWPYFVENQTTWLAELLDSTWQIAVCDLLSTESTYEKLIENLKEDFERSLASMKVIARWDLLYATQPELSQVLDNRVSLSLDGLELGVPENPITASHTDGSTIEPSKSGRLKLDLKKNLDLKLDAASNSIEGLEKKLAGWTSKKYVRIFVTSTTSQSERLHYLLEQRGIATKLVDVPDWTNTKTTQICTASLSEGFRSSQLRIAIVTDAEIFGPKKIQKKYDARKSKDSPTVSMESFVSSLEDINPGELIVHSRHGIGKYRGLSKLEVDRVLHDFLLIEYAGGDKLYLPVYRLDTVQKYVGATDGVALDKLGSSNFEKTKEKVKEELQELAHHLLQLYAQRAMRQGFRFSEPDEQFREFEAKFPYSETPDQLRAIDDVLSDMHSPKIMDRLVCGDVGYGKTEVAMRGAFLSVLDGKQVGVLVPTTVLALQHEQSFKTRFKDYPVSIQSLSRFKTASESKQTLQKLKEGKIDILIGTHRLLSKDIEFKDLGLLIIDEEQRFGVEHKEKLKNLKINTDVLTLTATPIPRTLHMSLMGLRDISVINTPPIDRLSVRTYVARFEEEIVKRAIQQEISRGGQVFFIHNRVQSINAMAERLKQIVPEAKIIVAHGQLEERLLEQKMLDFYNKKGNVLLCSTIIESGLDIPSANTIIINRADTFGLSQLYQLRGRVGRSQVRAFCYLLLPEEGSVTDDAKKRLEILQRFVDLGSGFKIAAHDLELRGGGDLLGKAQSGHIAAIGYELYTELLDETIREIRGLPTEELFDPEIKIPVPALLPESYVPDVHQRLGLYKRLSLSKDNDALHSLELELEDRFGKPPIEVQNLFWLIRIKQTLRKYLVKSLVAGKDKVSLDASGDKDKPAKLSPQKTLNLIGLSPHLYSLTPDSKILIKQPFRSAQQLFQDVEVLLTQVAEQ